MVKVWCYLVILTICGATTPSDPQVAEICKVKPKEKHCHIEYSVRERWPHTIRWVFDTYTSKCFEIRWSDHCPAPPSKPKVNNWSSNDECMNECSGWA